MATRGLTTIEVWKGRAHWHWHLKRGGRIVADAENFPSKANAIRAAKALLSGLWLEWGLLKTMGPCVFQSVVDKGDGVTRFYARLDRSRPIDPLNRPAPRGAQ